MAVVVGVVVGVGGLVGWRGWTTYVENRGVSASVLYEEMNGRAAAGDAASAMDVAAYLAREYDGTAYADLARLRMARAHYTDGAVDQAKAALQAVMEGAELPELGRVAALRLARIHLDQGELDAAEQVLAGVKPGAFGALEQEVRGDLLAARGDVTGARAAYERALAGTTTQGGRMLLQMKLDDLGSAGTAGGAAS